MAKSLYVIRFSVGKEAGEWAVRMGVYAVCV